MNQPSMQPNLPQWVLYDERNRSVCNFLPTVLELQQVRTPNGAVRETFIRLSLKFADGSDNEITVALSELDKLDWPNLDNRCIISQSSRKPKGYIANVIRAGLNEAPVKTEYSLDRTGIIHINNSVIFVAGDGVIPRPPTTETDPSFSPNTPFRLDIDENLTVKDAFAGMRELISLSPEIGRVLVAHVVSGIIRAAFKAAGFTPCAVLVITGKSGLLKSHYVPHLVQLYNRLDGIGPVTRFNSTKRFIEDVLYNYSECTAVIDDLHTAESKSIKRRNEETFEEIIRQISDDTGRGFTEGHTQVQRQFRGNVVFIGEYTVGKASSIPRALVVNLTRKPNGAILDEYQRHHPLVVSTFYFHFIQWYVAHFAEIRDEIDSKLTEFRKTTANTDVHGRLRDTELYLQISYMVFLKFCEASGCCSKQDMIEDFDNFKLYLAGLIQAQQARFDRDSNSEPVDYLNLIRNLYRYGKFSLSNNKKAFNPIIHDGLIHYGCLCLRGKRLENRLKQIDPQLNLNDCINSLLGVGALKLVENKYTVQIDGTRGKRFYAIQL